MPDKPHATLHSVALAEAEDLMGGRWAKQTRPYVVGEAPIAQVPRQPGDAVSNQWELMPPEPPLGFEINAQEAVGEPHEIAKSLSPTETSLSSHSSDVSAGDAPTSKSTSGGDDRRGRSFRRRI
jgi:hypothetical protein